tara:strand:+ start:350 stop:640 length:291 start_codon:yes stop_codon:yes gene_type:complete
LVLELPQSLLLEAEAVEVEELEIMMGQLVALVVEQVMITVPVAVLEQRIKDTLVVLTLQMTTQRLLVGEVLQKLVIWVMDIHKVQGEQVAMDLHQV